MNKELQRFLSSRISIREPSRRILNRTKDVVARFAIPAILSPDTMIRRMIAGGVDIVQMGRPAHAIADAVGPRGDRRQVALGVIG